MTEDLMLNLVVNNAQRSKQKNYFKLNRIHNRKKRIEARRKFKKKILKVQENVLPDSNDLQDISSLPDINKPKTTANLLTDKVKKSNRIGSNKFKHTLFAGNPTIPNICSKVEEKSDDCMYQCKNLFSDLDIDISLKSYIIEKMQLQTMTKVQSKALPVLLDKKDALIMSETGSGKTLTYALAVIQCMQAIEPPVSRSNGPMALILVPTRELALQCYNVFQRLTLPVRRLVATCIIGGQKKKSEKARIRKGVNIIVSTPGRFVDHMQHTSCLNLSNIQWLVFDEADRLLDMGFQKAMNTILFTIKERSTLKRQVILLSATLTHGVEKLVELSLTNPVRIEIKSDQNNRTDEPTFVDPLTGLKLEKACLPTNLTQYAIIVPSKLRLVTLLAFICTHCAHTKSNKLLIFVSCRDSVAFHYNLLKKFEMCDYNPEKLPIPSYQLHGGMSQQQRTLAIQNFKIADSGVIFCTDVAARGLDIPNVNWVVQYTSPGSPVEYIHRVGRTARAGHDGNALLFLTPAEAPYTEMLTTFDISVKELKVESVISDVLGRKHKNLHYNIRMQQAKETASKVHKELEELTASQRDLKESAVKAYTAFVRAYATYPTSLKHIFHVKNLHLGHVAKSFTLQEVPSEISLGSKKRSLSKPRRSSGAEQSSLKTKPAPKKEASVSTAKPAMKSKKTKVNPIVSKYDLMSEFSSGFVAAKKRKLK